jgi:transposase-like protein
MTNQTKTYPEEFKQKAIRLVQHNGLSVSQTAKELGVSRATLNRWIDEVLHEKKLKLSELPKVIPPAVPATIVVHEVENQVADTPLPVALTPEPAATTWADLINAHAATLVTEAFIGILGRNPEAGAIAAYSTRLTEHGQLHKILKTLSESQEFLTRSSLIFQTKVNSLTEKLLDHSTGMTSQITKAISINESELNFVLNILQRLSQGSESQLQYAYRHPDVLFRYTKFPSLKNSRAKVFIFIPDDLWLAFIIPIADYFQVNQQLDTVLIYNEWSPTIHEAVSLSSAIFEVISFAQFQKIPINQIDSPKVIVAHSFGWQDKTLYLLNRFVDTIFYVYADGFKNEVSAEMNTQKTIGGVFYFGYVPPNKPFKAITTIPTQTILDTFDNMSYIYGFDPIEPENPLIDYAVLYLRYWSHDPYEFSTEEIIQCILRTVIRYVEKNYVLIIKNDKRVAPELLPQICQAISAYGYTVLSFDDYLSSYGISPAYHVMPVEYFLARGLLCTAKVHVVFDSSVGYIVASHPNVKSATTIIMGSDISIFKEKFSDQPSLSAEEIEIQLSQQRLGIVILKAYTLQYSMAILGIDDSSRCTLIEKDGDFLYQIRKIAS